MLLGFCYVFTCTYLCTCWQVLTWLETNARAVAQKYKATDPTFAEHTQRWEMCFYMTVCTMYVGAYFSLCCARHPMRFSSTCVSLVSSSLLKCHSVTQSITIFTNQWNRLDTKQCSPTPCYSWWWLWISTSSHMYVNQAFPELILSMHGCTYVSIWCSVPGYKDQDTSGLQLKHNNQTALTPSNK